MKPENFLPYYNQIADAQGTAFAQRLAFAALLVSLILYLLCCLSVYALAKKRHCQNAYFAWMPVFNIYLLGHMAGGVVLFGKVFVQNSGALLCISVAACFVSRFIFGLLTSLPYIGSAAHMLGILFSLALPVWCCFVALHIYYRIFSVYLPLARARVFAYLSVITFVFPLYFAFVLKKEPVYIPADFEF